MFKRLLFLIFTISSLYAMETIPYKNSFGQLLSDKLFPNELIEVIFFYLIRRDNIDDAIKDYKRFAFVLFTQSKDSESKIIFINQNFDESHLMFFVKTGFNKFVVIRKLTEISKKFKEQYIKNLIKNYRYSSEQLENFLIEQNINPEHQSSIIAFLKKKLAEEKLVFALLALLNANIKLNFKDSDGMSFFVGMTFMGYKKIIKLLLNAGTNPDIQDKYGDTPLLIASENQNKEIIELLLNAKANPNIQNKKGETALMRLANKSNKELVELLLKSGADLSLVDNAGRTIFDWAEERLAAFLSFKQKK